MPPKAAKKPRAKSAGLPMKPPKDKVRRVNRPPRGSKAKHAKPGQPTADYAPSGAVSSVSKQHKFHVDGDTVVGSECFYDFNVPPSSVTPGFLNMVATNVNAQNGLLFPVLSALAADYERYKFEYLEIEFTPNSNTSVNAKVALMFDYDAADVAPATFIDLANNDSAKAGGQATPIKLRLKINNDAYLQYFCSTQSAISTDQDVRTKFPASFFCFLDHWNSAAAGQNIGQLWVNYKVHFTARRPPAATSYRAVALITDVSGVNTPLLWTTSSASQAPANTFTRASVLPTLAGSLASSSCARDGGPVVSGTSWPAFVLPADSFNVIIRLTGGATAVASLYVGVIYFSTSDGAYLGTTEMHVVNPTAGQQYDQWFTPSFTSSYAVPYYYSTALTSGWTMVVQTTRNSAFDTVASLGGEPTMTNYALPSAREQLLAVLADPSLYASVSVTTYEEEKFDDDARARVLEALIAREMAAMRPSRRRSRPPPLIVAEPDWHSIATPKPLPIFKPGNPLKLAL